MNMKNILFTSLLACLFLLSGCADKNYITEVIGSEIISEQISVKKKDWKWNNDYARLEASFDVSHINKDVDRYGEVNASILVDEKDKTEWKFLPFSRVFEERLLDENGKEYFVNYTEQYSFGYQIGKVTFYIENSDKIYREDAIPEEMYFKVSSILDSVNLPE